MNLAQMRSRVAANVGRESIAGLDAHFNSGQLDLAKDGSRVARQAVTVADDSFTLPANCLALRSVAYQYRELKAYPGDTLPAIQPGVPQHYLQFGATVYVFPRAAGTYTIAYAPRPADLASDASVSELPDASEALIAYATWQYFQNDGDAEAAALWRGVYLERKTDWLDLEAKRNYQRVRVGDALAGWWGHA